MIKQLIFATSLLFTESGTDCFLLSVGDNPKTFSDWELDKNSGGVKTYVRWVKGNGSSKVRERKGEMDMDCTVDDVIRLICDTKSTALWMSGVEENYRLKQVSQSEWYAYTLFDIPWPFEKRDLISVYKLERMNNGEKAIVLISSKENFIAEKPHITRLNDYTANWIITKTGDKKVAVAFSAISNTPPMFPRFIQDPILAQLFHNNLVNMKKIFNS